MWKLESHLMNGMGSTLLLPLLLLLIRALSSYSALLHLSDSTVVYFH